MPLILKEWDALDAAAHKAKMPKSALLRSVLAGSGAIPALTVNGKLPVRVYPQATLLVGAFMITPATPYLWGEVNSYKV